MKYVERYGTHAPKKENGAITAVLVILAVLLAAVGIVTLLAFNDPYAGRGLESVSPSGELPQSLAKAAISGKEAVFSRDEVNGYLAYLFQKHESDGQHGGVKLLAVAAADASGDSADLYLPVTWRGKRFGVSLNVTPSLDATGGKLLFRVNSARVGRLPVPTDWVLTRVESRLPEGLERDGDTVFCAVPSLKAEFGTVSASASLTQLRLNDGELTLAAGASVTIG
jgi:hypothetical protein